ncbi:hypothetical protein TcasGA2_TC008527 [Tribolium castaneum]|uniref:Uncharacterized protein n=1 Tax=Tribolium castaneum TaxID=7070 RepID=D2A340_TRICA|nr:hypothetical protein TcasGA2_TC008527 [Tribolium castaneum]
MPLVFDRTERELNQRNSQAMLKFTKKHRSLQHKLAKAEDLVDSYEEKCANSSCELQTKQCILGNLKEELSSTNEEFRVQELEARRTTHKRSIQCDSLTDVTNIDLEADNEELG